MHWFKLYKIGQAEMPLWTWLLISPVLVPVLIAVVAVLAPLGFAFFVLDTVNDILFGEEHMPGVW